MSRYWRIWCTALVTMVLALSSGCSASSTPAPAPTKAAPAAAAPAAPAPTKAAAAPAATAAPAQAAAAGDKYPSKPVTIICVHGVGGGTDVFSRAIAMTLAKALKQSVVVNNVTGASGATGQAYVAKQPADGYTIMANGSDIEINDVLKRGDTTRNDFTPIGRVQHDQGALWVKADSPYKTIQDLLQAVKANPDKVKFGIVNAMAFDDVLLGTFGDALGVKLNTVPFQSGSESLAAVLGGHVDVMYDEPGPAWGTFEAKKIRPLMTFTEKRLPLMEDVPTSVELGYNVTLGIWRGLWVKKGTPDPIVKTLETSVKKAAEDPIYKAVEHQTMLDMRPGYLNSADFAKFIESEFQIYNKTMTKLGFVK